MDYSIIYSCDVPRHARLIAPPPEQSHLWSCTERSGGSEGQQMDWGVEGPEWSRGRHRKYCAVLDQKQFDDFVEHVAVFAEDVETGGSIGAPGFGFGWAPAIAFNGDDYNALQSAYVTPIPACPPPLSLDSQPSIPGFEDVASDALDSEMEAMWQEIRSKIIETYA